MRRDRLYSYHDSQVERKYIRCRLKVPCNIHAFFDVYMLSSLHCMHWPARNVHDF